MLWRALRLVAGLAIGVALWWSCGDAWNRALAVMARPLMKLDSRIAQTDLVVRQLIRGDRRHRKRRDERLHHDRVADGDEIRLSDARGELHQRPRHHSET